MISLFILFEDKSLYRKELTWGYPWQPPTPTKVIIESLVIGHINETAVYGEYFGYIVDVEPSIQRSLLKDLLEKDGWTIELPPEDIIGSTERRVAARKLSNLFAKSKRLPIVVPTEVEPDLTIAELKVLMDDGKPAFVWYFERSTVAIRFTESGAHTGGGFIRGNVWLGYTPNREYALKLLEDYKKSTRVYKAVRAMPKEGHFKYEDFIEWMGFPPQNSE